MARWSLARFEEALDEEGIQLIADAQAEITTWTVADAIDAVGRPDVVFVDIREPEELARDGEDAAGHGSQGRRARRRWLQGLGDRRRTRG